MLEPSCHVIYIKQSDWLTHFPKHIIKKIKKSVVRSQTIFQRTTRLPISCKMLQSSTVVLLLKKSYIGDVLCNSVCAEKMGLDHFIMAEICPQTELLETNVHYMII